MADSCRSMQAAWPESRTNRISPQKAAAGLAHARRREVFGERLLPFFGLCPASVRVFRPPRAGAACMVGCGRLRAAGRLFRACAGGRQGKRLAGLGLFRTLPAADDRRYGFASRCGPLRPEETPWPPIARRRFSGVRAVAAFFCPLFPMIRIIKLSFNGFCVCRYGFF